MKWSSVIGAGLASLTLVAAGLVPATAAEQEHDRVASTNPADWVPVVEDGGGLWGTATVGGVTVAGGSFTSVRQRGAASSTARTNIFAFNANGQISSTFTPSIALRVWDVIPAGDGVSVFVGGQFNNVNGLARTAKVARINVHTGQVMTTFRSPGFTGIVTDLHLANGRLYVGGYFDTVGGQPHSPLVALDPDTGAVTDHLNIPFADAFNSPTSSSLPTGNRGVGVERFAMTPDGRRLIAIGNFRTVGGQPRVQVAMIDTSGPQATVSSWSTNRFSGQCAAVFPTYTLGIDTSPDSKYFVIATGGAFMGGVSSGTLCDTISRWEVDAEAPAQDPTWVNYMGGDTSTAVHVTGSAVYIGGHFRWTNSPFAGDVRGPGAVDRKGMASLDPRNGLPYTFNAGKLPLKWGVGRFNATSQGLWVAHDGDNLGNEYTGRLGLLPLAGGKVLPADNTGALPGDVYMAGRRATATGPNPVLHRVNAGGPAVPSLDGWADWEGDTGGTSPFRSSGSNSSTVNVPFTRTPEVPASTPTDLFATERWDPSGLPRMEWDFPVAAGVPIEVRLYFANGYSGTSQPGQRIFDVALEGSTVLDDYDIVADTGDTARGTMKSWTLTSDGNVDIDFSHVVENPLVNAIEIVRTDIAPPPPVTDEDELRRTPLSTSGAGTPATVPNSGIDWSSVRAGFMADGRLYNAWSDGTFTWRPLNSQNSFGTIRTIAQRDLTAFTAELQSMTSMWFDRTRGRLYFTLQGQNQLYYRYFTPESTVVGAVRFTEPANGAVAWNTVRSAFLANGRLWFSSSDGTLRSVEWDDGAVPGTVQQVSGPGIDSVDWAASALFLRVPQ